MTHRRTLVTLIGLMLFSLLMLTTAAQQSPPKTAPFRNQLMVSDAVVRGGPGESFVPVGQLTPDSPLIPVSIDESGQWVLLRYNRGFGWIRRDLVFWTIDLDALPVITSANLTPTIEADRKTATPFFPTSTPHGSYVQTTARSAYVRAGPGRTYPRLDQLFVGDKLEPVSRNDDGSWVMIRTADGFGWIQRPLGVWSVDIDTLPVIDADNLTPTATFTASPTHTHTVTPSPTVTPTHTLTPSPTVTATLTPSPTVTATLTPSPTVTATLTPSPTVTATLTPSPTVTHTHTLTPSPTVTHTHTLTPSPTVTATLTKTSAAVAMIVPSNTPTQAPSETHTLTPSNTPSPTPTPTLTPTLTDTPASAVIIGAETPPAATPLPPDLTDTPSSDKAVSIPPEAIVGGLGLLAIIIYVALYLRGLAKANRYNDGFIIEECPACRQGKLSVEVRQDRLLGIPQPHFTVRCSNCRSVLREVGRGQWRYAVDPLDNPPLYERYNNRTLDERTLLTLHKTPIKPPTTPVTRPDFVEGEQNPPDA